MILYSQLARHLGECQVQRSDRRIVGVPVDRKEHGEDEFQRGCRAGQPADFLPQLLHFERCQRRLSRECPLRGQRQLWNR